MAFLSKNDNAILAILQNALKNKRITTGKLENSSILAQPRPVLPLGACASRSCCEIWLSICDLLIASKLELMLSPLAAAIGGVMTDM